MTVRAPQVPHVVKDAAFESKRHRGPHGRFAAGTSRPKLLKRDERAVAEIANSFTAHPIPSRGHAAEFTRSQGTRIHPDTVNAFHDLAKALRRKNEGDARVKALDEAMTPLSHDLILTRHVSPAAFGLKDDDLHHLPDLLAGRKIVDRAYTPTALHQADQPGGITMHIAAPAGTKALVAGDNEVWLDRDLELAVTGAYANGRGGYTVELTVLPKGAAPAKKAVEAVTKATPAAKATTVAKKAAPARKVAAPTPQGLHRQLVTLARRQPDTVPRKLASLSDDQLDDLVHHHIGQPVTKDPQRFLGEAIQAELDRRGWSIQLPPAAPPAAPAKKAAKKATTTARKAAAKTVPAKRTVAKKAAPPAPELGFPSRAAPKLGDLMDAHAKGEPVDKQIAAAIDGQYGGLNVKVANVEPNGVGGLVVSGTIHAPGTDPDEEGAGVFERLFYRDEDGNLVASHEYLQLNRDVQGSGFAREFNANLFDWYRRSGFDRVEVHADIDVGGYTWSTQGFDFENAEALSQWLYRARRTLDGIFGRGGRYDGRPLNQVFPNLTDDQIDSELQSLDQFLTEISNGRPASTYEISQLGRKPGMGKNDMWVGKFIMLGSDWRGALRL